MKNLLLIISLVCCTLTVNSQLYIKGHITPSDRWEHTLYITRIDHINLGPNELVDSISLSRDGYFSYRFRADILGGQIYKLTLPPKGGNHLSSIIGSNDNYLIISTEETDSLTILAHSDSLFYSAKINGGAVNRELLIFRDHSKPFFNLSRAWDDSITQHPDKADYFSKQFRSQWMKQLEDFKRKITLTLDTATTASTIMAGLFYLNSAYLGILPSDVIKKYLPRITHLDMLSRPS